MRLKVLPALAMALLLRTVPCGQMAVASAKTPTSDGSSQKTSSYIDPISVDFTLILSSPPAKDSSVTAAELTELHHVESVRSPAEIVQAQTDEKNEDIFLFRSVLGENFRAGSLPLTAALSGRIRKDESSVSFPLKTDFHRSRPYQIDSTLHPVCAVTREPTSYPSGHALSGYLLALTLVQILPEKREQIFKRADEYAHNRVVCGVHYPSDLEAGRRLAYAIFGALAASPHFQQDLSVARDETRRQLGFPPTGDQK
jgi:acid phosphatase (class A)